MDNDKYIGRLLDGRYEILEVIGTGGMAVVYKARCHRLNRLVAIKILKDEFSQDEEFRRRFHAESQAVAMLSHPNIMSVYDVSTSDEADYIVMELIDGITLKQYMEKKGTLNWKETLHFSMQIAKALEHAHSRGIVHRDIKPHNVMVLKNGSVKVTDFGIARIMSKSNTLTKEALGSVHYISPEQAKGGRVDNRSDLYSLGVVMYEMMTGRAPYDGESPVAVAIQHINGGAPMPSTLNPNIPGGLEQIIMKAMALDPDDRYPSATEMLYDLEELRKNPAILFDFSKKPGVSDETMVRGIDIPAAVAHPQQPRTTAERVAGVRTDRPAPRPQNPRPQNPRPQQPRPQAPGPESNPYASEQRRDPARSAQMQARRERMQEQEKRNRTITMAVAVCSAVAVVAIVIFLVVLFSGNLFGSDTQMVPVPDLIGQVYQDLDRDKYPNVHIIQGDRVFHDTIEEGRIVNQEPKKGGQIPLGGDLVVYVSMGPEQEKLPVIAELKDMTKTAAENYINALKGSLVIQFEEIFDDKVEEGKVVKTEPAAGTQLKEGQTVTVFLSKGPAEKKVNVPNVIGKNKNDARQLLERNGFKKITEEPEESLKDKNTVVRMSVEAGESVDVKQEIILYVSTGEKKADLPNVVGMLKDAALEQLRSAGFTEAAVDPEEEESLEPAGTVLRMSPEAASGISLKTKITLYISKGSKTEWMPRLIGKNVVDAQKELNDLGFQKVRIERQENEEDVDIVFSQSIAEGNKVDLATEVILYVSDGPKETEAPEKTLSMSIDLPMDRKEPYKLTITFDGQSIVKDQSIKPGTTSYAFQLRGKGKGTLKVLIDGKPYMEEMVDFNA